MTIPSIVFNRHRFLLAAQTSRSILLLPEQLFFPVTPDTSLDALLTAYIGLDLASGKTVGVAHRRQQELGLPSRLRVCHDLGLCGNGDPNSTLC